MAVKLNLTGGPWMKLGRLPAHRTYHVHPNFVAATCAGLHAAGAKRIVLLESGYSRKPLEEVMADGGWDIAMINAAGNGKVYRLKKLEDFPGVFTQAGAGVAIVKGGSASVGVGGVMDVYEGGICRI